MLLVHALEMSVRPYHTIYVIVILPASRASLELVPIVTPIVPLGLRQPCATGSQKLRSYRLTVMPTVFVAPGRTSTLVKPFRMEGGSPEEAGMCKYSCGIYTPQMRISVPRQQSKRRDTYVTSPLRSGVLDVKCNIEEWPVEPRIVENERS